MAYDEALSDRVREYLADVPGIKLTEKEMFGGIAFLVNQKMCVNVSGNRLMCRYDPAIYETVAERNGFEPMIMRGKQLKGYCLVEPEGFRSKKDFDYWMSIALDFNTRAKRHKK